MVYISITFNKVLVFFNIISIKVSFIYKYLLKNELQWITMNYKHALSNSTVFKLLSIMKEYDIVSFYFLDIEQKSNTVDLLFYAST